MILFLIPVTKIPFGNYYFQCLDDYWRNPFEKGSALDVAAQQILHHGIELHVSFYEDFEHAVEEIELFDSYVKKEIALLSENEVCGPSYVYTKGLTIKQVGTLLEVMPAKAPRCILAINMPPHDQPLDDTVNPYCLNKLE